MAVIVHVGVCARSVLAALPRIELFTTDISILSLHIHPKLFRFQLQRLYAIRNVWPDSVAPSFQIAFSLIAKVRNIQMIGFGLAHCSQQMSRDLSTIRPRCIDYLRQLL